MLLRGTAASACEGCIVFAWMGALRVVGGILFEVITNVSFAGARRSDRELIATPAVISKQHTMVLGT